MIWLVNDPVRRLTAGFALVAAENADLCTTTSAASTKKRFGPLTCPPHCQDVNHGRPRFGNPYSRKYWRMQAGANIHFELPDVPKEQHLADVIHKELTTSTFDTQERRYLPETCLKAHIVTNETVEEELHRAPQFKKYPPQVRSAFVSWIVNAAPRVFAITVQCHLNPDYLLGSMLNFCKVEFADKALPIRDPKGTDLQSGRPPRSSAFEKKLWTDQRHDEFFDFQWSCLAPVFEPARYEYDLWSQHILPLKKALDIKERGGSFSKVFKVAVHPDHQQRHSSLESPDPNLIQDAIHQLRGIADALDRLHNFQGGQMQSSDTYRDIQLVIDPADNGALEMNDDEEVNEYRNPMSQESIRHGDLKPENILRFLDSPSKIGTLKLGDMGLAKRHVAATEKRLGTSMRYGTSMYEGPETRIAKQGRSRLYDIWSMGCITFEFIIWLLHGNDALKEFYSHAETSSSQLGFQYYVMKQTGTGPHPVLNPIVTSWMDHLEAHDPELQTGSKSALKDLLQIVREQLLIVDLPPTRGSALADGGGGRGFIPSFVGGTTKYRATAAEFRKSLDSIKKKEFEKKYIYTGQDRSERTIRADYSLPPLESWEFEVDHGFAAKAITRMGVQIPSDSTLAPNKLCNRCANLNFWSSGFDIEDVVEDLMKSAAICDFCKLRYDVSSEPNRPRSDRIRFERSQSVITLTGNPFPVLSIFRSPELETPIAIQIGSPVLPDLEKASACFFDLAKEWLKDCDEGHAGCRAQRLHNAPTRLIDVGTLQQPVLRLVETQQDVTSSTRYIALSHPWGDTNAYEAFVTLRHDNSQAGHDITRFKNSIPYNDMPKTFKHAVDCARNLNVRYLWIDSICIIQGKDGDFGDEAKRMEDVYSGAYCVIAASRAMDQRDGFLGARPQRQHVTFNPETPFYVCRTIDRFNEDVIMGPLNQRGWVLQERALARRTMYFTKNQTYFECGNGVRCETLSRMHNNMADFLGDPNFPDKAMRVPSRALKIEYFQGLYKQYSRLSFTRWQDRPIAIAGLEKRLQRAFSTKGRYGIFDDGNRADGGLFHRSLLWRREWKVVEEKDGEPLEAISFPAQSNMHVPTWSWMAYKGGIDYTDPPYNSATWETRELIPPWTQGGYHDPEANEDVAIAAVARDFDLKGHDPKEVKIAYDTENTTEGQRVQCVIVARSNDTRSDQDRRYYVLLVIPTKDKPDDGKGAKYKRVGAGFMLGKYIKLDTDGTEVRIF
ncbi:heterokaryon incompatibility protein-domain-containing protein [Paraphoma chrysanthemicola]|uniref:Heterokaryon incompatibility protein-domain-containing protein n=1 Tax=Paraphoma chrysanthemicola TaxID=798071 RepID=A0A8K0W4S0_9PLEO|nr:heterokaryon incompatibility protein-domain-containing protein [Paraphoma chrysanthemicola]